jgi:galactokinase
VTRDLPDAAQRIMAHVARPEARAWYRAPGRVNLIGDHTDYNDGFVLPMAIDRTCVVAGDRSETVRVFSLEAREAVELPADGTADVDSVEPPWGRYVAAVVHELATLGRPPVGIDAVLASDVPIGSGLSSSAALEVACAVALAGTAGWEVDPVVLATACREAEERATGVPCGIMDQLASSAGRSQMALLIDCRSREIRALPLPTSLAVLVVHSGVPRAVGATEYAERRRACERLAEELGVAALRDAGEEEVADAPVGRHVVTENRRVLEAARALETGDLDRLGHLLVESHESLRDDFRVSTPELDALVEELVRAGALGARLTGAGFGGCVVAACRAAAVHAVAATATSRYRARTGLEPTAFPCRAVAGAGPMPAPRHDAAGSSDG